MLCQFRLHSPWGANVPVSNPNQLTPVRVTSWPLASNSLLPEACSGPDSPWLKRPFRPDSPAPATDATRTIAITTDTRITPNRPGRGRFRYRRLSDTNIILQKNQQQIGDAGNFAYVAVKSGVECVLDSDRVRVARQRDRSGAG